MRLSLTVPSNELANILGVSVISPKSASKVDSSVVVDLDDFFSCFIVRRLELYSANKHTEELPGCNKITESLSAEVEYLSLASKSFFCLVFM